MTAPQEKRYFYSKPHHALSMMLDHGMELLVEHFATKELLPANPEWLAMHICGKLSGEPVKDVRLFVASQSMHLLEPQDGDLVQAKHSALVCGLVLDASKAKLSSESHVVIKRNGLAFHMPESEAA